MTRNRQLSWCAARLAGMSVVRALGRDKEPAWPRGAAWGLGITTGAFQFASQSHRWLWGSAPAAASRRAPTPDARGRLGCRSQHPGRVAGGHLAMRVDRPCPFPAQARPSSRWPSSGRIVHGTSTSPIRRRGSARCDCKVGITKPHGHERPWNSARHGGHAPNPVKHPR